MRQTFGRCHDSVNPCATTIARSELPGRWMASIGTRSFVTRVDAITTGLVMLSLRRSGSAGSQAVNDGGNGINPVRARSARGLAGQGDHGESFGELRTLGRRRTMSVVQALADAIRDSFVEVIDLTAPLSSET